MGSYNYHIQRAEQAAKDADGCLIELEGALAQVESLDITPDVEWAISGIQKTIDQALQLSHVHATIALAKATKEK